MFRRCLIFFFVVLYCHQVVAQAKLTYIWYPSGLLSVVKPYLTNNNYLVTHAEIRQRVQSGYFTQREQTTIPNDNRCITVQEAKSWLFLNEGMLPVNGRLPLWQELVAVAPTCSSPDLRWINGSCQLYINVVCVESVSINARWSNTRRYEWSDGSFENRTVIEDQPCIN